MFFSLFAEIIFLIGFFFLWKISAWLYVPAVLFGLIYFSHKKDFSIPILSSFFHSAYFKTKKIFFLNKFLHYLALLFSSSHDGYLLIDHGQQNSKKALVGFAFGERVDLKEMKKRVIEGDHVAENVLDEVYKNYFKAHAEKQYHIKRLTTHSFVLVTVIVIIANLIFSLMVPFVSRKFLAMAASAPTITSVSPNYGPISGGTSVTITGANFVATPTVFFGSIPATSVTLVDTATLTVVSPAVASSQIVDITVTNPDTQSATLSRAFAFANTIISANTTWSSNTTVNGIVITNNATLTVNDNVAVINSGVVFFENTTTGGINLVGKNTIFNGTDFEINSGTAFFSVNKDIVQAPSFSSLRVDSGSVLSSINNTSSYVYALILSVSGDANIFGSINLDGKGYVAASGTGAGISGAGSTASVGGGGAGHGGVGGIGNYASGGVSYDSITAPILIGSGGGNASDSWGSTSGGSGGGALKLVVSGTTNVSGTISAAGFAGNSVNGYAGYYAQGGGGSGGSIWIQTGALSGSGTITASGGSGLIYSGGGAGGMIALNYTSNSFSGTEKTYGGAGYQVGAPGTIFTKQGTNNGDLLIDNNGVAAATNTPIVNNTLDNLTINNAIVSGSGTTIANNLNSTGTSAIIISPFSVTKDVFVNNGSLNVKTLVVNDNINISSGATMSAQVLQVTKDIIVNGTLTHDAGYTGGLNVTASNLTINTGGFINLDGKGYAAASGTGAGSSGIYTSSGASVGGGGGGYGGVGGAGNYAVGGVSYGTITAPILIGSGGGGATNAWGGTSGGSGGGALKLVVSGTTNVSGTISAAGFAGNSVNNYSSYYVQGGGGSGGSIWIQTGALSGSGTITASGGSGLTYGGGGAGGMIALNYTSNSFSGTEKTYGGAGYQVGAPGTIFTKQGTNNGDLLIDNNGVAAAINIQPSGTNYTFDNVTMGKYVNYIISGTATLTVINSFITTNATASTNSLIINSGGALNLPATDTLSNITVTNAGAIKTVQNLTLSGTNFYQNGTLPNLTDLTIGSGTFEFQNLTSTTAFNLNNLTIQNGGILTHKANTTTQAYTLNLNISGNLTINTGGSINLDGKGYVAASGTGAGISGAGSTASVGGGGAGHGGVGGIGNYASGGVSYDSITAPILIGSGGGNASDSWGSTSGGSGGGALKLVVSGTTNVSGTISAAGFAGNSVNGYAGYYAQGGGGSGGSIWIQTGALSGSGTITASGGSGLIYSGGGAGGMIALNYTSNSFSGTEKTYGGAGYQVGAPGTIFTKQGTNNGDLLIDNNGVAAATNTPIVNNTLDNLTINNAIVSGSGTTIANNLNSTGTSAIIISPFSVTKDVFVNNGSLNVKTLVVNDNINISSGATMSAQVLQVTKDIIVNGTLTHDAGYTGGLNVTASNLTINTGGFINLDGKGYAAASGTGAGSSGIYTSSGASVGGGGGGYGGVGGAGNYAVGGVSYGTITAPILIGSGGGGATNAWGGTSGGSGGGALKLVVSGTTNVSGTISAAGFAGNSVNNYSSYYVQGGGGSGGSIWIQTGALSGSGTITASGGSGLTYGGGGGGGRIALYYYSSKTYSGVLIASGATGANGGAAGTIYEFKLFSIINDPIDGSRKNNNPVISGTASSSNTISLIEVLIKDNTVNSCWNGSVWAACPTDSADWPDATGTDTWSYTGLSAGNYTNDHSYTVRSRATDSSSIMEIPKVGNTFVYDNVNPSVALSYDLNRPVRDADTLRVTATFSEAILDSPIPQIAISYTGGGSLSATNMIKTDATHYYYDVDVPAGSDGTATITISGAQDLVTNPNNAATNNTFIVDNTPPDTTVAIANAQYNAAGWNSTSTINGTASDATSGVALTEVAIMQQDGTPNHWWNGSDWSATSETWVPVTTGTTTWYYTLAGTNLTDGKSYTVKARATDNAGNITTTGFGTDSFAYDTTSPTTAVTLSNSYYNATTWNQASTINGTASDATSGIASVQLEIQDNTAGSYWSGTAWGGENWLTASGMTAWNYSFDKSNLASGHSYTVSARATDGAGNLLSSGYGTGSFNYDSASPIISFSNDVSSSPVQNDIINVTVNDSFPDSDSFRYIISPDTDCSSKDYSSGTKFVSGVDFTFATQANNGKYICIKAADFAGNVSFLASAHALNIDTTAPASVITNPDGVTLEYYQMSSITGTASDNNSLGTVYVSIKDTTDGTHWWSGSDWSVTDENNSWLPVTSGTDNWTYNSSGVIWTINESYLVKAKAVDAAGNSETPTGGNAFTFINSHPEVSNISARQENDGEANAGKVDVSYAVTDAESSATTVSLFYDSGATLASMITSGTTTENILTSDIAHFPAAGTIMIGSGTGDSARYEYIDYTGKNNNYLTGITRRIEGTVGTSHDAGEKIWIKATTLGGDYGLINNGTGKTLVWNAAADSSFYTSALSILIASNDGASANNIGIGESATFEFDSQKPVFNSANIDAREAIPNDSNYPANLNFNVSDDMGMQMLISLNADLSGATWQSYASTATITLAANPDTVYVKFKDAKGNMTDTQELITPNTPSSVMIQDISSVAQNKWRLYVSWETISTPAFGFDSYRIYRSNSQSGVYAYLGTTAAGNVNVDYYSDTVNFDDSYYYKLAARDANGNFSFYSNYVWGKANATQDAGEGGGGTSGDTTPPQITVGPNSLASSNSATITWTTDKVADSYVEYGADTNYGLVFGLSSVGVSHSVTLPAMLSGSTLYHYRVKTRDTSGNLAISPDYTFTTTAGGDVTPPIISAVSSGAITSTSATITWTTDENSSSYVDYGTTQNVYTKTTGNSSDATMSHTVNLTNLTPNTTYYFRVRSVDGSGNEGANDNGGANFSFATPGSPTISNVNSINVTDTVATIIFTTSSNAYGFVDYGTTNSYGQVKGDDANMHTSQSVQLLGLTPGTTYHYRPRIKDIYGNYTFDATDYTFATVSSDAPVLQSFTTTTSNGIYGPTSNIDISATYNQAIATGSSIAVTLNTGVQVTLSTIDGTKLTGTYTVGATGSNQNTNALSVSAITIQNVCNANSNCLTGKALPGENINTNSTLIVDTTAPIFSDIAPDNAGNIIDLATSSSLSYTLSENINTGTITITRTSGAVDSSSPHVCTLLTTALNQGAHNNFDMTSCQEGVPTLVVGSVYTISFSGTDIAGNVSSTTEKIAITYGLDSTPPQITAGPTATPSANSATITWTTNEPADSYVEYGLDSSYGAIFGNTALGMDHSVTLPATLSSGTLYHFRVKTKDAFNNLTTSNDNTFTTTAGGDVTPPIISAVSSGAITSTSATITWTTDENSSSYVDYGTTQNVYTKTTGNSSDATMSHTVNLTNLTPNTTYYFRVRSVDGSGNEGANDNGGSSYSFETLPPDLVGPVITFDPLHNISVTKTSATISWVTDKAANSLVDYGILIGVYSDGVSSNIYNTNHHISIYNLTPNTTYYFRLTSVDSSFNQTIDDNHGADYSFTTSPNGVAITFSDVAVGSITDNAAVITWTTNETVYPFVDWGGSTTYGNVVGVESILAKTHSIKITGLSANTTYHFRPRVKDTLGNFSYYDKDSSFTTTAIATLASSTESAPTISSPSAGKITSSSAEITWKTDKKTNAMVKYALTSAYNQMAGEVLSSSLTADYLTDHVVALNNLLSNTTYHFVAISVDISGNIAISGDKTFTTSKLSSLSGVKVSTITLDGAIITWETSDPTTSEVDYGNTTGYGQTNVDKKLVNTHKVELTNLGKGQTYHFRIKSEDRNKNITGSDDYVFATFDQPKLVDHKEDELSDSSIAIAWTTSTPTQSFVEYASKDDTGNVLTQGDSNQTTDHKITIKELTPGTSYSYKIKGTDINSNSFESDSYEFTTSKDISFPVITQVSTKASIISGKEDMVQTIVSWLTNKPATSQVVFGEGIKSDPAYEEKTNLDTNLSTNHIVVLSNFKPGAMYHIKVASKDKNDNETISQGFTVLAPNKNQSIIQIIVANFEQSFGWVKKMGL